MTSDHILTVREVFPSSVASLLPPNFKEESVKGPQALSCAAIADLVAFRLPSSEQSWCILVSFICHAHTSNRNVDETRRYWLHLVDSVWGGPNLTLLNGN